jgi:uncharacterized protein (TIGR00266 family)
MQHEVKHGPSFATLTVQLQAGETITAESDAMITHTKGVSIEPRLNAARTGGLWGTIKAFFVALIRKIFGGETMFVNDFTASENAEIRLAPVMSGHIVHRQLNNERLLLQPGSYLASSSGLSMRLQWAGLRGLLSKEGIVFVEMSGTGDLFMTAYGGIQPIEVDGSFVVDNGHIVAFDAGLDFKVTTPGGGLMGLFGSGEGLVCHFTGRGTVWIQSRNTWALVDWITRLLP